MDKEKAIEMIDEYLLEPNNINKEWVECLQLCKQALEKLTSMSDMTDNEIIEALENCGNVGECQKCLLNEMEQGISLCIPHLTQNALNLINRQKAEIDILIRKKEKLRDEIAEKDAEIERLQKLLEQCEDSGEYWESKYIDAIKEFAERLKSKFTHSGKSTKYGEFTWDDVTSYEIDNLVKEMVGDKE